MYIDKNINQRTHIINTPTTPRVGPGPKFSSSSPRPQRVYIAIKHGRPYHIPESQFPQNGDDENMLKKIKSVLKAKYRKIQWQFKLRGWL